VALIRASALLGLALVVASPSAGAAPRWWGANYSSTEVISVDVPAGALRPGPATAWIEGAASTIHKVRFVVRANQPASLRLMAEPIYYGRPRLYPVRVTSDAGGSWETNAEPEADRFEVHRSESLFIGTAAQLGALQRGLDRLHGVTESARRALNDLRIAPPLTLAGVNCRVLAQKRVVIVETPALDVAHELVRCAARGARVLLVRPESGAVRVPQDHVAAWGLGELAVAAGRGDAAAGLAAELATENREGPLDSLPHQLKESSALRIDVPSPVPVRDLLALLGGYVLLIGPVGYWVGHRSGKTWLAWGWFPLAATGATMAILLYSSGSASRRAQAILTESSITDPAGSGLLRIDAVIEGSSRVSYALAMPWVDADLGFVGRPHRFGSPFAAPAGALHFDEDASAGTARLSGLGVDRLGTLPVDWLAPVDGVKVPVLEFDGSTVFVRNPAPETLSIGRLIVSGRIGRVSAVAGGTRQQVDFTESPRQRDAERGVQDWIAWPWETMGTPRGYLLVAEYSGAGSNQVRIEPRIPTVATTMRVVAGPLPDQLAALSRSRQ
jgi:hypothetical protein